MSVVNTFWLVGHQFVERFTSNNTQASFVLDSFPVVLSTRDFAGLNSGVERVKLLQYYQQYQWRYLPAEWLTASHSIQYYLTSLLILFGASVTLATNKAFSFDLIQWITSFYSIQQITSGDTLSFLIAISSPDPSFNPAWIHDLRFTPSNTFYYSKVYYSIQTSTQVVRSFLSQFYLRVQTIFWLTWLLITSNITKLILYLDPQWLYLRHWSFLLTFSQHPQALYSC